MNWWLERLANCVGMGDQIVEITSKSVTFFKEEKERLEKKMSRPRSATKADYDEHKDDKKTLAEVNRLLKEWESKYYFSKSLVKKLGAAEKVYSNRVKEVKYCKPLPRIFNIRHSQISSSKEIKDIEDIKLKAGERKIKREENQKREWRDLIAEGVELAKDTEKGEKADSSKKKATDDFGKNEASENDPSGKN